MPLVERITSLENAQREQCDEICPPEKKDKCLVCWASQDDDPLASAVSMNQGNEDGEGVCADLPRP
ncbi:hypothetical protein M514_09064 [Trichuris suis]|uniref:Uncharacterized protein n=1 Tax=Trichuris suis TaxID=68888 RepID=A0A085LYQ8_9BILA|nr:hypothetical protein M513_09064 [Trichuris suis]KFD60160.1 hypothetical protein M514_09064 [Trichuris suis]